MLTATRRWVDSLVDLTLVRLNLWLLVVLSTYPGFLLNPHRLADWFDDHSLYAFDATDRLTLLEYGQLPVWNPFWCGGTAGIAEPEDAFYSPDFMLRLVFGTEHGRRLALILYVVLGLEGMYRFCRRLDSSAVASGLAAVSFATFARFLSFIHDGWVHFLSFELLPWVLLALLNGIDSVRWRIIGGIFFAWIVLAPGTYPAPYTVVAGGYFLLAFTALRVARREPQPIRKPLLSALTLGVVALLLAFCKLVPTMLYMREFPRTFTPTEVHTSTEIIGALVTPYGAIVLAAVVGTVLCDLAAGICIGGALLFFALNMGEYSTAAPFHLLKQLPVLGALRWPDRFAVVTFFFVVVAASRGLTRVEDLLARVLAASPGALVALGKRFGYFAKVSTETPAEARWIAVPLAAAFILRIGVGPVTDLVAPQAAPSRALFVEPAPVAFSQPFKQARGNRRDAHIFPALNMGSLNCVAGIQLAESARLRGDLAQEEYPADPSVAKVQRLSWSPNEIILDVDATASTLIYVNQNWDRKWGVTGGELRDVEGLLAVAVPAGKTRVALRYRDRVVTFSLLVSLVSLAAILFIGGRKGWQSIRREVDGYDRLPTFPGGPLPLVEVPFEGPPEPPAPTVDESTKNHA